MIIKCKKCGKEVPESGILFDEKAVMNALKAPLDCQGNPIFDYSQLKQSRIKNENYCYWCGAKLEIEAPKAQPKPQPKQESKSLPPLPPLKSRKLPIAKWMWILLGVLVAIVIFFCVRSCGSDSDNNMEDSGETLFVITDYPDSNDDSSAVGDMKFKVKDYSAEWAKIEDEFNKLGTARSFVNAHSGEKASEIKKKAESAYKSIDKKAEALYKKIDSEAEAEYHRIDKAAEAEYHAVDKEAEKRYHNDEIDYSTYNDIYSKAYAKYSDIYSKAYSKYSSIYSTAYSRYSSIYSKAYSWYSDVNSICYNLE